MPADERAQGSPEAASFRLVVVDGLDLGRELRVDGGEPSRLLVGKGPSADLKLVDPAVSRRHLALEIERGRLRVTDLGSTNGTQIDGHEVVDAFARGGETLRIGATSLQVERLVSSAEAPPSHGASRFARVIGASPAMRRLYPVFERLAASQVPVVI